MACTSNYSLDKALDLTIPQLFLSFREEQTIPLFIPQWSNSCRNS